MPCPLPPNESRRLEALRRYRVLDTPQEEAFDDLAALAAYICQTPIAMVSLVDEHRQWFKASVGMTVRETPREQAFCGYTILSDDVLVVEDATRDTRFATNPLVTVESGIRFYAGAPLIDQDGLGMGSVCVIDKQPRQISSEQSEALRRLARQATALLEQRRLATELAGALERVKTIEGLLPVCSHCRGVRDDEGYWSTVEDYLARHTELGLSHGVCPDCLKTHYPRTYERMQAGKA